MKTAFSKKTRPDPELLALKAELLEAQGELALAYRRFDQAVDPELVESCVYQISAVKARCNYLIRTIKERDPHAIAAVSGRAPAEVQKKNGENLFTDEENTDTAIDLLANGCEKLLELKKDFVPVYKNREEYLAAWAQLMGE